MSRWRIEIDGDLQDEVFDNEEDATDYALYLLSCIKTGAETLFWSNPGDNPYDEDTYEDPDYEVYEED